MHKPQHHQKRFTEGLLNIGTILSELALLPGQVVADVGCGTGYMALHFAEEVGPTGQVYALDINELYIRELQERSPMENVSPLTCDMSAALPLASASVDVLYISTVIHSRTSEQVQSSVGEVRRVLKPDGILAVVEIAKHDTPFGPPLRQRYSPEELQAAIDLVPVKTVAVAEHFYMQLFRNQP